MTVRCRWCGITRQQYHDLGGSSENGPHEWVEDPPDTSWVTTEDIRAVSDPLPMWVWCMVGVLLGLVVGIVAGFLL